MRRVVLRNRDLYVAHFRGGKRTHCDVILTVSHGRLLPNVLRLGWVRNRGNWLFVLWLHVVSLVFGARDPLLELDTARGHAYHRVGLDLVSEKNLVHQVLIFLRLSVEMPLNLGDELLRPVFGKIDGKCQVVNRHLSQLCLVLESEALDDLLQRFGRKQLKYVTVVLRRFDEAAGKKYLQAFANVPVLNLKTFLNLLHESRRCVLINQQSAQFENRVSHH